MQLTLKWWQAKLLRDEIDAGLSAVKLGREGGMVMDSGNAVKWDSLNLTVEVPPDEPGTKEARHGE